MLGPALALFLAWGAPTPFTVTFRFGNEVIGPERAIDMVLPNIAPRDAGKTNTVMRPGSDHPGREAEIWVTLAASPASRRISQLARATAEGRPVTGSCEIVVAARDGGKPRRYTIAGCFAKSVDGAGDTQRVTLGYSTISVSE